MEKKVSFFEAWNRALSLEVERQYFNRYLGKNLEEVGSAQVGLRVFIGQA